MGIEPLAEIGGLLPTTDFGADLDEQSGRFMDTAAVMKDFDLVIPSDTAPAPGRRFGCSRMGSDPLRSRLAVVVGSFR